MLSMWVDAVIAAPIKHSAAKINVEILVPILSIIIPPIKTIKTFGMLYIAFNKPMSESEK
jgi:hypothetical protein